MAVRLILDGSWPLFLVQWLSEAKTSRNLANISRFDAILCRLEQPGMGSVAEKLQFQTVQQHHFRTSSLDRNIW